MSKIKILDCTLRDGGYINDWKFGKKAIQNILFNLSKANTEIARVGINDFGVLKKFLNDKSTLLKPPETIVVGLGSILTEPRANSPGVTGAENIVLSTVCAMVFMPG